MAPGNSFHSPARNTENRPRFGGEPNRARRDPRSTMRAQTAHRRSGGRLMARENADWSGPAGCGRGAATRGAAPWRPPAAAEAAAFAEGSRRPLGSAARVLHCSCGAARDPKPVAEEGNPSAPVRLRPPRRVACVRRGAEPRTGSLEHWRRGLAVWGERKGDVVKTRSEGLRRCRDWRRLWIPPTTAKDIFSTFTYFSFFFSPLLVLQKTFV